MPMSRETLKRVDGLPDLGESREKSDLGQERRRGGKAGDFAQDAVYRTRQAFVLSGDGRGPD